MLCSHFTQNCTFWRLEILVLWRKNVENLLTFVYLFCPKNDKIHFTKTFITQEWLLVESCPTRYWITFSMLSRLVYDMLSFQWINFGLKCLFELQQSTKRVIVVGLFKAYDWLITWINCSSRDLSSFYDKLCMSEALCCIGLATEPHRLQ